MRRNLLQGMTVRTVWSRGILVRKEERKRIKAAGVVDKRERQ